MPAYALSSHCYHTIQVTVQDYYCCVAATSTTRRSDDVRTYVRTACHLMMESDPEMKRWTTNYCQSPCHLCLPCDHLHTHALSTSSSSSSSSLGAFISLLAAGYSNPNGKLKLRSRKGAGAVHSESFQGARTQFCIS